MRLSELLTPSLIKVGLESEEKEELFEELVQLFIGAGVITDREAAIRTILERERKMSTGIARGIGLPHGKLDEAKGLLLAVGTSKKGIEYDALDGEPVYIVIMVFAEAGNPGPHIEALAEISRLCSCPGFTERLRGATSPEALLQVIRDEE